MLNAQAIEWLKKHAQELPPEELPSEEEKIKVSLNWVKSNGLWPTPQRVPDMGPFVEICTQDEFNKIISNPLNWGIAREREDLYNLWILPNAVLLFGKSWFDSVKWKQSIRFGVPFPLFSKEEKRSASENNISLEETPAGRAMIARIISKTSYALKVYLEGKWYKEGFSRKNPGGYIIDSLRNDISQRIGADMGYKQHSVYTCPNCFSYKEKFNRSVLISHGSKIFGCLKCEEIGKNLELRIKSKKYEDSFDIEKEYKRISKFGNFTGITCVCPSNKCSGHFIPIDFANVDEKSKKEISESFSISGIQVFKQPPKDFLDVVFECPYCDAVFTPREALQSSSGYKGKSGYFTGLPKTFIWEKSEKTTLDCIDDEHPVSLKNKLASSSLEMDINIIMKQKINLLIDELIVKLSKINKKNMTGLVLWYFYNAAIKWMMEYWEDAYKYFFEWQVGERDMSKAEMLKYPGQTKKKITEVMRGQEVAIHQSFFHIWMKLIEENINEFNSINPNIKELKDFKWFWHKCPGGPILTFKTRVEEDVKILKQQPEIEKLRFAKIYSIFKEDKNYTNDILNCEWQVIKLKKESSLRVDDIVEVKALFMSGHPTHAPIQRILRLRSMILYDFIVKILEEEDTGKSDLVYWSSWRKAVEKARLTTGLSLRL